MPKPPEINHNPDLMAARAIQLHNDLLAEGFSKDEIIGLMLSVFAGILEELPQEEQMRHIGAHIAGLAGMGLLEAGTVIGIKVVDDEEPEGSVH